MLVYVWSRRNPLVRLNFFGLINFFVSTFNEIYIAILIGLLF